MSQNFPAWNLGWILRSLSVLIHCQIPRRSVPLSIRPFFIPPPLPKKENTNKQTNNNKKATPHLSIFRFSRFNVCHTALNGLYSLKRCFFLEKLTSIIFIWRPTVSHSLKNISSRPVIPNAKIQFPPQTAVVPCVLAVITDHNKKLL